jgi:HIP---CoA ligase
MTTATQQGTRRDLQFHTIYHMLKHSAKTYADCSAICDGETTLSYHQLLQAVDQAAQKLIFHKIALGDRVAIWAPNCWQWIVSALAVHTVGGVVVPINTRYKGHEAAYLLTKSRAKLLFTQQNFLQANYLEMLENAEQPLPDLQAIVLFQGKGEQHVKLAPCTQWENWKNGKDSLVGHDSTSLSSVEERSAMVGPDSLCDIIFTSGTTGQPKGVMCTHAQTLRAFGDWSDVVGLQAGDRYLIVLPFFHSFGYKAGWLSALMMGATIYPHAVFEAVSVLERIPKDKISVLPGPPALYQTMLAYPELERIDRSSLRLAVTGAAVIPVELIRRMGTELGFKTIITGYGLTESCGIATMCRYDDDPETIATTSGKAIPGVQVRIVDDTNQELPTEEPGEIVISGYNVMNGYFEDEEQTKATIDSEGWLHTGDVGVMNDRGYLRITDRKKDMFIVGGFNAYPAEIENVFLTHPGIAQVAVVGIPDDRLGEVGLAYVVARADATLDEATLIAWARERMANYKVPRLVRLVSSLPMNATGKVLKFELRAQAHQEISTNRN